MFGGTGLLEDVVHVLGTRPGAARRLSALPHILRKGKTVRDVPAEVVQAAIAACERYAAIEDREGSPAILSRLIQAPDMQTGEALLFALAIGDPSVRVFTGDRRSIVALGSDATVADLVPLLSDRVVCLEVALRLLVEKLGVGAVARKLHPMMTKSRSLRIIFSEANLADDGQGCRDALDSYIDALGRDSNKQLVFDGRFDRNLLPG